MKTLWEVQHYVPAETVVNRRNETETYGGYANSKGVFESEQFAIRVAKYFSNKEKIEYRVIALQLWDEITFTEKLKADFLKEFEFTL